MSISSVYIPQPFDVDGGIFRATPRMASVRPGGQACALWMSGSRYRAA